MKTKSDLVICGQLIEYLGLRFDVCCLAIVTWSSCDHLDQPEPGWRSVAITMCQYQAHSCWSQRPGDVDASRFEYGSSWYKNRANRSKVGDPCPFVSMLKREHLSVPEAVSDNQSSHVEHGYSCRSCKGMRCPGSWTAGCELSRLIPRQRMLFLPVELRVFICDSWVSVIDLASSYVVWCTV